MLLPLRLGRPVRYGLWALRNPDSTPASSDPDPDFQSATDALMPLEELPRRTCSRLRRAGVTPLALIRTPVPFHQRRPRHPVQRVPDADFPVALPGLHCLFSLVRSVAARPTPMRCARSSDSLPQAAGCTLERNGTSQEKTRTLPGKNRGGENKKKLSIAAILSCRPASIHRLVVACGHG